MNRNLQALNRAFERAFSHTTTTETLTDLLVCLGEELDCDRISIFEVHEKGYYSNTYQWCREGVQSEKDYLQHLPLSGLGSWHTRLVEDEIICVEDLENIRDDEKELYSLLNMQEIHAVIVSRLSFHGKGFGFFSLENPAPEIIEDTNEIMPGMRYILSSLVYSDRMIRRLERLSHADTLTGARNRLSLQDYLDELNPESSLGLLYCDAVEWDIDDGSPQHIDEEQMILHASMILRNVYSEECVYRMGAGEFLVVCPDVGRAEFRETVGIVQKLFLEKDIVVAMGTEWTDYCASTHDYLIREAHMHMLDDKKELNKVHKHKTKSRAVPSLQEKANISIYRSDNFFQKANIWLSQIYDENIITLVIDVNYFNLYSDIFGPKAANMFLESIADTLLAQSKELQGIAGYLGADSFCMMIPTLDSDYAKLHPFLQEQIDLLTYTDGFAPVMGVYLSTDRHDSAVTMYDWALSALSEIKGSYTEHIRFYDEEHFKNIHSNKLLLIDARKGLKQGDFLFYVQPQVHERTGMICGAEALIRWNHNGHLRTPGSFLSTMEKSGAIFELDCYIWEKVCMWLRDLIDRGINPVPCSVNVSRIDFYFTDIADHFLDLVQRYDLDPSLVGVEITESAVTDNTDKILEAILKLHEYGFRIFMDDFGSGSSSLSMLHKMNVDVLKTDVNFMSQADSNTRAISIIESMVSMAHMIGIMVITEGVETKGQRDNLLALGDNYAQGFYFYKPMPVEHFELLLQDPQKIGEPPRHGDKLMTNRLRFRDMVHDGILSESLLDNLIGPAAVFKEVNDEFVIMQMNDSYSKLTGIDPDDHDAMEHFINHFHNGDMAAMRATFHGADGHPLEGSVGEADFERDDGEVIRLRSKVFMLYSYEDHKMYLSTIQE